MNIRTTFISFITLMLCTVTASAAEKPFTKTDIEKIIHDYMMEHPEVIVASVEQMQQKQAMQDQGKTSKAIALKQKELLQDPASPFAGNPKGDVTIVEFFDYNCGYCKTMVPALKQLIAEDKNLRIVFKELPILSPTSLTAAQIGIAVFRLAPAKYMAYHAEVMKHTGNLTEAWLLEATKALGLDPAKVKAEMTKPEVIAQIAKEKELASALGIAGTPAFIIGNNVLPGAVGINVLKERVAAARKK